MTDTTVASTGFGMSPAASAIADNRKKTSAIANAAEKTQDFSAVFNNIAQSKDAYKGIDSAKQSASQGAKKASNEIRTEKSSDTVKADTYAQDEISAEEEVVQEEEKSVDEMTIEQIADALQQIIDRIKELLGVTDAELLNGMETMGLQPVDLLDSANMAQLLATISGEGSAINLVANEELYAALQDITELIDTQVSNLLEETGLTEAELNAALQNLRETGSEPTELFANVLTGEQEAIVQEEGPIIIKEDNTQPKEVQELPENQQEELTESIKLQTQKSDNKGNEDSDAKDYGQHQNLSQNFQNSLNETINAVGETVESFTSESTENILRQLADMVKIVKGEELTEMEMQLHPASLGTVNVSLTTKGGVVTAEFTTQNEAVKAAIEAQASQLRTNLEEQGVKVEAIEVSVESHQMERNLDKDNKGQQQAEEQRTQQIQGIRRKSINLRALENGEELVEEMQGADDATRIAMELMAANGNTMDLLA